MACPSGPRWRRARSGCWSGCSPRTTRCWRFPAYARHGGQLPVGEQARALRDPAFRARLLADMETADDARSGRRAPAPPDRLRPPLPAGRRARLRAAAGDERAAARRGTGPRSGRAAAGPAGGERRPQLPLHPVLQLRRREPRRLRRDARPSPHHLRPGRRRRPRRASSPTPASRPTRSPTGPATAPTAACPWARSCEQLTSATAGAVGLHDRGVLAAGHAGRPQRHRLRPPGLRGAGHGLRPARRAASGSCRAPAATAPPSWPGRSRTGTGSPPAPCPGRLVRGGRDARAS